MEDCLKTIIECSLNTVSSKNRMRGSQADKPIIFNYLMIVPRTENIESQEIRLIYLKRNVVGVALCRDCRYRCGKEFMMDVAKIIFCLLFFQYLSTNHLSLLF
jgi:superfamily I DNA and/or RNA helicase